MSLSCSTAGGVGPSKFCSGASRASCGLTAWLLAETIRVQANSCGSACPLGILSDAILQPHLRIGVQACEAPSEPCEHGQPKCAGWQFGGTDKASRECTHHLMPVSAHAQLPCSRVAALKLAVCLHVQGRHCPPPRDLQASALSKVSPATPAPCPEVHQAPKPEAALSPTPTRR